MGDASRHKAAPDPMFRIGRRASRTPCQRGALARWSCPLRPGLR
ncbi:hypothetical protein CCL09_25465 [Pseudomonas congelans]|nr:hypothetical protein CCL09_25465 [Pseudomonas congelans]